MTPALIGRSTPELERQHDVDAGEVAIRQSGQCEIDVPIAIIIVSYGQAADIVDCLLAIDRLDGKSEIGVFVVENAGSEPFQALGQTLAAICGVAADPWAPHGSDPALRHRQCRSFKLPHSQRSVMIAEATCNLGYAGGVNSWLEQATLMSRWAGFWILNPDTAPTPRALQALVEACVSSGSGMAGSVITDFARQDTIMTRGLMWRPMVGSVFSVDRGGAVSAPASKPSTTIDAPSGTSIYVTRSCLDAIGFMSEDFFLYFEDVEWGLRAKKAGLLCFAEQSLVPHKYGSAIGSAVQRRRRSRLSVYLDTRNIVLFTRRHDPWFTICTVLRQLLRAAEYLIVGSPRNCLSVLWGLLAGLKGEVGKPEAMWLALTGSPADV